MSRVALVPFVEALYHCRTWDVAGDVPADRKDQAIVGVPPALASANRFLHMHTVANKMAGLAAKVASIVGQSLRTFGCDVCGARANRGSLIASHGGHRLEKCSHDCVENGLQVLGFDGQYDGQAVEFASGAQ